MSLVAKLKALKKQIADEDAKATVDALVADAEAEDALLAEANREATAAKASYTGLQTTHQRAVEAAKLNTEALAAAQAELSTAKSEAATALRQVDTLTGQLATVNGEIETGKGLLAAATGKLNMYDLITDKFPALQQMRSTLIPLGTDEATTEMLTRINDSVTAAVEATVAQRMQGYVPDVNFQSSGNNARQTGPLSTDALLQDALSKAGTPAFDAAISGYYRQLEAAGEMPVFPAPRINGLADPAGNNGRGNPGQDG